MPALIGLLAVLAYVVYRRRGRPGQRYVRLVAAALGWCFVGFCVLIAAILVAEAFVGAPLAGRAFMLSVVAAGALAWQARRQAGERSPERVARIDRVAFVGAYAVYAGAAVIWLVLGLVPALAAAFPSFADQLREWGEQDTLLGDMAARAAGAGRNSSSGVQVTLDYAFSILNITLATFLVVKVRGNRTANLLAIGMVGTAVAFNLQSHAALVVIGTELGGFTDVWHNLGVHVLAGIAYVFALLLFPDGSIDRSRGPHLMGLAVFFGLVSFVAIPDHTSALVLLFGVLVPAAALLAHSRRFREAQSPELRQLYRLLGVAMGVSLVGAVAVLTVTSAIKDSDDRFTESTRDYEFRRAGGGHVHLLLRPSHHRHGGDGDRRGADLVRWTHADRRDRGPRRPVRQGHLRARGRADQRDPVHQHRRGRAQRLDLPHPEAGGTPSTGASSSRARTWPPSPSGCSASCSPSSRSRSSSRSCATTCGMSIAS